MPGQVHTGDLFGKGLEMGPYGTPFGERAAPPLA